MPAKDTFKVGQIVRRDPRTWPGDKHGYKVLRLDADSVYIQRIDNFGKPAMDDDPWHPGTRVPEAVMPYLPSELKLATLVVGFGVK